MHTVNITIEFKISDIALVPHQICPKRIALLQSISQRWLLKLAFFFSEGNLTEEVPGAPVVSMAPSQNIC